MGFEFDHAKSAANKAKHGSNGRKIKAARFDRLFDEGKDVSRYIDWSKARRPGLEQRRVNVDFPVWMIESLDREAARLGVPRQSLIKLWIAERVERLRAPAAS